MDLLCCGLNTSSSHHQQMITWIYFAAPSSQTRTWNYFEVLSSQTRTWNYFEVLSSQTRTWNYFEVLSSKTTTWNYFVCPYHKLQHGTTLCALITNYNMELLCVPLSQTTTWNYFEVLSSPTHYNVDLLCYALITNNLQQHLSTQQCFHQEHTITCIYLA